MKQNKLLLIPLFLFLGCGVSTKLYKKVATDPNVTVEKLSIIAPFVSANFPVKETFIQGKSDTTLIHDTTVTTSIYYDTITNRYDSVIIKKVGYTKLVLRTDTIKVKETIDCYYVNQQLTIARAKVIELEIFKNKMKWLIACIAIGFFLTIIIFVIANKLKK